MPKKLYQEKLRVEDWKSEKSENCKATNITKIKAFSGFLLHMGVVNLPNLQDYWSRDPLLQSNCIWKRVMSRDCFLLLLRFWHFKDEINPESWLQKISPLINHLNNTMSKIYCADENLSRDEWMILWKDRLILRQYIKKKRCKYGVKLYRLCKSTGIILRTSIYSGVSFPDPHDLGQTGAIVMNLLTDFIGKRYTVYVDNYYNFVQLTQQLSSNKIYICGT